MLALFILLAPAVLLGVLAGPLYAATFVFGLVWLFAVAAADGKRRP